MSSKSNNTFRLFGFGDNLDKAISYVNNPKKIKESRFLWRFLMSICYPYVKSLKQAKPDITKQEVEEIFSQDIESLSEAAYSGTKISQHYMNYLCYEVFAKDHNKLDSLVNSMNTPTDENALTFKDLEKMPKSTFELALLYYASKLKNDYDLSDSAGTIYDFLDSELSQMSDTLKDNIIDSVHSMLVQLDKFTLLDNYLEINKKKMDFLKTPELSEALESANPDHKSEKILEIFSDKKNFDNYSPADLLTLYSFWINRYYKELDTYLEAMFIIRDLDFIPAMLDENFKAPSNSMLRKCLAKINLFYEPNRFYLEMQKSDRLAENNESELDISENIYRFSDDMFVHYVANEYGDQYKKEFDSRIPESQNDLVADAKHYFKLYNPIYASYNLKDVTMLYLLMEMIENSKYPNAGVTNADTSSAICGIAIDSGMNETFSLHIKKSVLEELLAGYMGKSNLLLPMYNGKVNYTYGKYSVPLLLPFTSDQVKAMESIKHDIPYNSKEYLKHLKDLKDKRSNISSKQFVDLSTGELKCKSTSDKLYDIQR